MGEADTSLASFNTAAVNTPLFSPTRVLEVSTDADGEFFQSLGNSVNGVNAEIQSVMNSVEAIYLPQLGLKVKLRSQHVFTATSGEPYTTVAPSALVDQFRTYSIANHQLKSADAYHLFTGKDLSDNIVGIAYLGVVCNPADAAYGLSQRVSEAIQAMVTAHEIGHNLGANHDNSTQSLMSPGVVAGFSQFSDQSLTNISDYFTNSQDPSCLATAENNSAGLSVKVKSLRNAPKTKFTAKISLSNAAIGCNAKLYGATTRDKLKTSKLNSATFITAADLIDGTATLTTRIAEGDASATTQSLFFRAEVTCGSEVSHSSIREAKLFPYGKNRQISQAIRKLFIAFQAKP